jgi:putative ABC transport system permease protein
LEKLKLDFFQLFSIAFEALKDRRLRASLTILIVVMGAGLIVALDSTGNGFSAFINEQFASLGANVLILQPRGGSIDIDQAMVDAISKYVGIKDTVPYIQQLVPVTSRGKTQTTIMVGMDQTKLPLLFPTMSIDVGQFVATTDRIGILFGSEVAQTSEEIDVFVNLGQTVSVLYQQFEAEKTVVIKRTFNVRGILKTVGSGIVPVDQMVFISTSAANSFFNRGNEYDGIYVITDDPQLNKQIQQEIRERYSDSLTMISPQAITNVIDQIRSGVYFFISSVAYVSLLVASVGIITTLHTSMMERIREIGLLKALGFNNRLVLSLFLGEAVLIGAIGASIGLLSGMGLSYVMTLLVGSTFQSSSPAQPQNMGQFALEINPIFSPLSLLSTWLLCLVLSIIAGFYPAWRASRMDPVVALRHE